MATIQGMCRNCGSLIMFDDRDTECECVFCNCIFPSSEAVEIFENPEGRTFPNEKFEPSKENKHHHTTRVFSDEHLETAIKRDELARANKPETKKDNEFEISPNDVKAPRKLVIGLIGATVAIVALVIVIALPIRNRRKDATENIMAQINTVFEGIEVDATLDESGNPVGYNISGQSCQHINILTEDQVDESKAKDIFDNYCDLRADILGIDGNTEKGVKMNIYCDGGIYTIDGDSGEAEISFSEDSAS
ncbi:MAG: hypothetical protein IKT14_04210 [Clostridiales bacterium]|nr:hypothetical protein [Clostridiales bacterium]MBR6484200.1 hypothetical protein [Clostridiales bacterium]